MADENITGKRIKDLCRQKGITVRELAEKSNTTQIPMSRFITGARMPNAPILKNIAKALETTTDYLLGGDQEWRRSGMKVMLDDGAYMPERAHEADAGYDIKSPTGGYIPAHSSWTVDTGVHVQIPKGYVGFLKSKSGLNVNHGLVSEGVIDSGYTGSIVVKLYNHSDFPEGITKGQKITQLVILPIETPELELADWFEDTDRGDKGFGSSGK